MFRAFMVLINSTIHGIDGTQIKPVKYVINTNAPVFFYIFNLALSTGTFPDTVKLAKVFVLHKGGDRNVVTNYRPMSLPPYFLEG